MQEQAIASAREMQRRSRMNAPPRNDARTVLERPQQATKEKTNDFVEAVLKKQGAAKIISAPDIEFEEPKHKPDCSEPGNKKPSGAMPHNNPEDNDKLLIMALLVILSQSDADKMLMLALLYIMM